MIKVNDSESSADPGRSGMKAAKVKKMLVARGENTARQ
jgi:hypothetical protein